MGCIRFPPAPGGAETHVYEITKRLIVNGHEVEVFTSDLYKEIPFQRMKKHDGQYDGIRVHHFRAYTLGGDLHYVMMPSMFLPMLRYECDIIHVHSYGYFHVNIASFKRSIQPNIKMVFTPHFHPAWSMWGGEKRKKIRRIYDRFISRFVIANTDAIIGVSSHEIQHMRELGLDMSKVHIIPNGIDTKLFNPPPQAEKFLDAYNIEKGDKKIVLYVGRLASNKGLDILVRSAKLILKNQPNTLFVLVGSDAGERSRIERMINGLGLNNNFILTGHIKDPEIFRAAYTACDIFVLPSEYEAFGIVLLEAMACGKPCVATRVGGVSEVVEDGRTGVLVEYGDVHALAKAISYLLDKDDIRMKMGQYGRNRVLKNFDWDVIVSRIEKVYSNLF